jgi:hypothetical protein
MPRKPPARKHPSELRYGDRSPAELREGAEALHKQARTLDGIADSMDELNLPSITVDSVTKLERGLELVRAFLKATEKAVINAKYATDSGQARTQT